MRAARLPVEEQLAADLAGFTGACQPDYRVGSLLRRAQQGPRQAVEDRQRGLYSRGVSPAGVHGIDHDILVGPRLCPVPGDNHQAALGPGIGDAAGVVLNGSFQLVEVQPLAVHAPGHHIDHPGLAGLGEQRLQPHGKPVGTEQQQGETLFQPLRRFAARVKQRARVIDQRIDRFAYALQPAHQPLHFRYQAEVGDLDMDAPVAGHALNRLFEWQRLALVANDQGQLGPQFGQPVRSRQTQPRAGAGDNDMLVGHPAGHGIPVLFAAVESGPGKVRQGGQYQLLTPATGVRLLRHGKIVIQGAFQALHGFVSHLLQATVETRRKAIQGRAEGECRAVIDLRSCRHFGESNFIVHIEKPAAAVQGNQLVGLEAGQGVLQGDASQGLPANHLKPGADCDGAFA